MKVRLPLMVQDPTTTRLQGIKSTEDFFALGESYFLDGPVVERVAVLDFDVDTGELVPGARFIPPGRVLAHFDLAKLPKQPGKSREYDITTREFNQVCVLATILRTMYMFELYKDEDVLGRRLTWAFDAPQLLVIPRAGEWANAYYERDTHSLQFFYFPSAQDKKKIIFTSLSRDIVSHETAHAILDGIAPDLYNALTPQSLALHEAIADLTAVLMAFRSHNLTHVVLAKTNGSIRQSTEFSSIAEEFGRARDPLSLADNLRSLYNQKTLDDVPTNEPHALSEVLSGALYAVMVNIHEDLRRQYAELPEYAKRENPEYSASGRALADSAKRFRGMIFRALDYLPPGDISFADYGRAIIAADQAIYPDRTQEREWVIEEFVKRGIAAGAAALSAETNYVYEPLQDVDLDSLIHSDWVAYQFANAHWKFLHIPPNTPFKVRPRMDVTKVYYKDGEKATVNEFIFKVSWDHVEPNPVGSWLPSQRRVTMGTTLVIDRDSPDQRVRVLLTSDRGQDQREHRDQLLHRMVDDGLLHLDDQATGPDGQPLRSVVRAESTNGFLRVRGTARMLHIAGQEGHRG